MKKDKVTMFAEESYNDLDDNIGIVMPILTDCDVDEDFTEGMEESGEELPILPLGIWCCSGRSYAGDDRPPKSAPDQGGRPQEKSDRVVCQKDMNTEDPKIEDLYKTELWPILSACSKCPTERQPVILQGKKRFQLEELSAYDPYLIGKIKLLEDVMPDKSNRSSRRLFRLSRI